MLFFDIETDGLLEEVTKIHCLTIIDDTDEVFTYRPNEIREGIEKLLTYQGQICGHNIIAFDIPVIEKLFKVSFSRAKLVDTLVLARLVYSNINDVDSTLIRRKILPSNLYGRHSLKAYGYRLGIHKGTYAEDVEDCWAVFNEEMLEYNIQDVRVTKALYEKLKDKGFTEHASTIEHKIHSLMLKQEQNGFCFNIEKALALEKELRERYTEIVQELEKYAPKIPDTLFIPKRDNKTLGYVKGVPFQKYKKYNPNSRQQLKYILEEHYRYNFDKDCFYTMTLDKDGEQHRDKLKLDEETLKIIEEDMTTTDEIRNIAKLYHQSFLLSKRLGQLADGKNAWLKLVGKDHKIHGRVNANGAVSGRATHSTPNVAQVPSVDSPYGKECRELFEVPKGWYQAGVDCSGLELRCLAHFLYPFDDGKYAHEILNGDIHTANQINAGLAERSQAKTFIYGFLKHH